MSWLDSNDEREPREGGNFELIKSGWIAADVIDISEAMETASGGLRCQLTFEIVEAGPYTGRKVWHNLNLENANPKATQISKDHMLDMADAVGERLVVQSAAQAPAAMNVLTNKTMEVKIAVEKGKNGYEDRNVIKAFRKAKDSRAPSAAPAKSWR